MAEPDPSSIRSLAVAAEDVVDAAIYTRENPGTAVLRVTPPFHGRMRARLHVYHDERGRVTDAIHLEPTKLLEDDVLEAYPTFDDQFAKPDASEPETPDRDAADPDAPDPDAPDSDAPDSDAPDPDALRERREREIEAWRERATNAIRDSIVLEAGQSEDRPHRVDVKRLG